MTAIPPPPPPQLTHIDRLHAAGKELEALIVPLRVKLASALAGGMSVQTASVLLGLPRQAVLALASDPGVIAPSSSADPWARKSGFRLYEALVRSGARGAPEGVPYHTVLRHFTDLCPRGSRGAAREMMEAALTRALEVPSSGLTVTTPAPKRSFSLHPGAVPAGTDTLTRALAAEPIPEPSRILRETPAAPPRLTLQERLDARLAAQEAAYGSD